MPRETRIQRLVDHAEAMLGLLAEMSEEARGRAAAMQQEPDHSSETIAFLQDFAELAATLSEVIEDEIIAGAIGLNNLAGPLYHLLADDE